MKKPIVFCIMDGIGIGEENSNNAAYIAHHENFNYLFDNYPHSRIKCSGFDVGLPEHQMGNSEVGHLNIGAGRVVYQSLSLINKAISDGVFQKNEKLLNAMKYAKENNKKLHLMGVLSDGGVHSHINHLKELLKMAAELKVEEVYVHAFLDGRDTFIDSGKFFVNNITTFMNELGCGKLSTISGRYYAMDRDHRYDRNYESYRVMVLREGESFSDPIKYIEDSYEKEVYDEFIIPAYNQDVMGQVSDEDAVIFYNFRPDRAIQMASILTNPEYEEVFEKQPKNLRFVSMMKYDQSVIGEIAFEHEVLKNMVGPYLASLGKKQLRIAETEKYAHVTFFMDGQIKYDGVEFPELEGCKRILVESPKVTTYDLMPEMSAFRIKDKLLEELDKNYLDLVILNFANGDMVGHTGKMDAAVKAVETVDACIGEIYKKVEEIGGILILSADHGNCEEMKDVNGNISTTHTNNDVILLITEKQIQLENGRLSDIMPTILELMHIEKPAEMSGKSLIKK